MGSAVVKPVVYFLVLEGKQAGPFTLGEVQNLRRDGKLKADTLAWTEGRLEWSRADSFQDFDFPSQPIEIEKVPKTETKSKVAPELQAAVKAVQDQVKKDAAAKAEAGRPKASIYGVAGTKSIAATKASEELGVPVREKADPIFDPWAAIAGGNYMIIRGYHVPGMLALAIPFLLDCVTQGIFSRSLPWWVLGIYGVVLGFAWKDIKAKYEEDDLPEEDMSSNIRVLVICWVVCLLVGGVAEKVIPLFKKVSASSPVKKTKVVGKAPAPVQAPAPAQPADQAPAPTQDQAPAFDPSTTPVTPTGDGSTPSPTPPSQ
jgi:hypothetical protein